MTDQQTYISIAIFIIFIFISIFSIRRILKSKYLDNNKKRLNIIMISLIPMLWGIFILIFFSKPKKRKDDGYQYQEAGYSNYTRSR